MSRLLVVEDELHLAEGLRFNLEAEGYQVEVVETGEAALERLLPGPARFDVVVLDVMLPGKDGFTVMRELRQAGEFIPTLMLTARGHAEDILQGFEAGADDYLTKPFGIPELLARIKVQFKRRNRGGIDDSSVVRFGPTTVNLATRIVTKDGKSVHLTPIEYRMLDVLVRHAGRVLTRRQLLTEVWGPKHLNDTHYLRIYMGSLRQKLERNAAQPEHLITETGIGYRLIGVQ